MKARPIPEIPIDELLQYGVWTFDVDEESYVPEQDESWVIPVLHIPVTDFSNCIAVTKLKLNNNNYIIGILGNIQLLNFKKNNYIICLSIYNNKSWFYLNRYFDVAYDVFGPKQLAEFLSLSINEVFPITYDISSLAVGDQRVLKGMIPSEPEIRLTKDEIRRL